MRVQWFIPIFWEEGVQYRFPKFFRNLDFLIWKITVKFEDIIFFPSKSFFNVSSVTPQEETETLRKFLQ